MPVVSDSAAAKLKVAPSSRLVGDRTAHFKAFVAALPSELRPHARTIYNFGFAIRARHANLRQRLEQSPELERVVLEAMWLGSDLANGEWYLNRGHVLKFGARQLAQRRGAGRASGKSRRTRTRDRIASEASTIRLEHPYDRRHSTRWLAATISRRLGVKLATVRSAMHDLSIN